jgi:hypothetical protein
MRGLLSSIWFLVYRFRAEIETDKELPVKLSSRELDIVVGLYWELFGTAPTHSARA